MFNIIIWNVKISKCHCLLFFSSYDGISVGFFLSPSLISYYANPSSDLPVHFSVLGHLALKPAPYLSYPEHLPDGFLALRAWPVAFSVQVDAKVADFQCVSRWILFVWSFL